MTENLIICKEGTVNSYLSSLVVAMNMKKRNDEVSVVFLQEGLSALIDKTFRFSKGLEDYAKNIEENAAKMGVSTDPFELIKAANKNGIKLYACQAWMKLLAGKPPSVDIPEGLEKLELLELIDLMDKAAKIITL